MSVEEIEGKLRLKTNAIIETLRNNRENNNLKQGLLNYCDRAEKYADSRLSSAPHSFDVETNTNLKVTASACLKNAKRGKIHVQPEAAKRIKVLYSYYIFLFHSFTLT